MRLNFIKSLVAINVTSSVNMVLMFRAPEWHTVLLANKNVLAACCAYAAIGDKEAATKLLNDMADFGDELAKNSDVAVLDRSAIPTILEVMVNKCNTIVSNPDVVDEEQALAELVDGLAAYAVRLMQEDQTNVH